MKTSKLNKVFNRLKNWWFTILGILVVILDSGFDVINPILHYIGLSYYFINIIKALFAIYGIVKLKKSLPTLNNEKLKNIINDRVSLQEGDPTPGKGF